MTRPIHIHVTGDAYRAMFYIPRGRLFLKGLEAEHAHAYSLPVGVEYIARAIRAAGVPSHTFQKPAVEVTRSSWTTPDGDGPVKIPIALYAIDSDGTTPANDDEAEPLPVLRLSNPETQAVVAEGYHANDKICGKGRLTTSGRSKPGDRSHVLVHWLGELAKDSRPRRHRPRECDVHVQIGLASPLGDAANSIYPHQLAVPQLARVVVVNVGEISSAYRVRRSLSYEAIAVDLLRFLRGDNAAPQLNEQALKPLSMDDAQERLSVLAVRINSSALFLYAFSLAEKLKNHEIEEYAYLLCHQEECAPLSQPELSQMAGYTGFVSAQIAAAAADHLASNPDGTKPRDLLTPIVLGMRRSLGWQHTCYHRGLLSMLLTKTGKDWTPTSAKVDDPQTGYEAMFDDIIRTLDKRRATKGKHSKKLSRSKKSLEAGDSITRFDELLTEDVLIIPVQIERAVAHRTQWFMARSVAASHGAKAVVPSAKDIGDAELAETFRGIALRWLSKVGGQVVEPRSSSIPIVSIGDAELTDRREIEDFLAIHQALTVYATSRESKPLNVAVFGSPGAGKSFAVNQVVSHIAKSKSNKPRFKEEPLTFNLGQFKSLDDLPAALHLVRNESLSREIPIVFFDEFDSSFNGQPFGWLKFFLAPMQDGMFYHAGQNFKMGRAVFVFAGGVNRSFEELNGRVRNPGFCEAKGPDFISRLKAHLNVQGINKPDEEADQSRYILRRAMLLRSMVRKKLELNDKQTKVELLHQSVARALLEINRFKHGVRSLEAIIKTCATRPGHPIGPSDLPSMDQLEMHVDAVKLLGLVDKYAKSSAESS